jgi:4-carboxymuconolactone decarboxylase
MTKDGVRLTDANTLLSERRVQGRAMRKRVHGAEFVIETERQTDPFLKMYYDATEEFCWGTIWAREGLPIKERSMLALCMTAAKGQYPAVAQHVRTALRAGWSREEIGEMLLHVYCYAGC